VGKTTLLNRLIGEERFAVDCIREKDGKGRHTTARRQLICLPTGGLIVDTPGMRELGLFDMDAGLSETFEDIRSTAQDCRFKDCTHTHEAGCAVLEAVKKGTLDEDRYQNYLKIKKEAAYYQMSYLEKRRKDKMFGKMVKQVLKNKVKKRH
jgi:ribosome biogenesis GTPase